jgi:hypothetical protein
MATLVLYYSSTGHTKTVARLLARELDAELGEIICPAYGRWFGPLLMAWDIFTRRRPPVQIEPLAEGQYDLTVVGGPVWAGRPAPPVISVLARARREQSALALFVTCGGTNPKYPPERALAEMEALASPVVATCIFTEAEIASVMLRTAVAEFAVRLRQLQQ